MASYINNKIEFITLVLEPFSTGYQYPKEGKWAHTKKIQLSSVAKVDKIRDKAISLIWTVAQLYKNRGQLLYPHGFDYGLICCLTDDDRFYVEEERLIQYRRHIGVVKPQTIEIIISKKIFQIDSTPEEYKWIQKPSPPAIIQEFINHKVGQPWINK